MKKYIGVLVCLCLLHTASAQLSNHTQIERAAPAKTGLSYEGLTKFYQSTVTSGKDGGFDFKSSLFGIERLFSSRNLNLSSYYLAHAPQRNLELSLGLHQAGSDDLNATTYGLKYAIVNNRDRSHVNFATALDPLLPQLNAAMGKATTHYLEVLSEIKKSDPPKAMRLQKEMDDSIALFNDNANDFKFLPYAMRRHMDAALLSASGMNSSEFMESIQERYDNLVKAVDQRALLTFSGVSGYNWSTSAHNTTTFLLQYLKGFGSIHKPWDVDFRFKYQAEDDSAKKTENLTRSFSTASLGVNKTLIRTDDDNPLLEFELAAEYLYVINGLYLNENKSAVNGISTLRVHVSKEITIPVTLKYDIQNANVLGFLQLQWNFENKKDSKS